MKKALVVICCVVAVLIAVGIVCLRPMYQRFIAVDAVRLDPQLTIYTGGGGNSIVLTSEDGAKALVVDTKLSVGAKKQFGAVRAGDITIVNTHAHHDHSAGNALYPSARIIAGAYSKDQWAADSENSRYPDKTIMPGEEIRMKIGSENIIIRNMGRAHSWNDVVVYLEKRKLLVAGDILFLDMHPVLLEKSGTNTAAWGGVLDALGKDFDIMTLVPGHGKPAGKDALVAMKDYFVSIGDSAGDPAKQSELKKKYDGYYSLPGMSGFDMTLAFIEKERGKEHDASKSR